MRWRWGDTGLGTKVETEARAPHALRVYGSPACWPDNHQNGERRSNGLLGRACPSIVHFLTWRQVRRPLPMRIEIRPVGNKDYLVLAEPSHFRKEESPCQENDYPRMG